MLNISRTEKEKFISQFNEEEFRDRVVRRLFVALKFRDGRDTCGPEEYGKDAIFVETDKLGVENIIAVQTKKGNINLAGDPAANLHTLVTQLQTALNQPHVCVQTKRKILPSAVYVAASGKINQAARSYIAEQLKDARIRFLDRDDLISRIDEACPELWSGVVADVSPYLKALANRVEDLSISGDINPVQSSIGAYAAASDQRFVDVKLGTHTPRLLKKSGQTQEVFDFEEKSGTTLLSGNAVRALLLGEAGTGKTTLLIRLAYLIAKQSINTIEKYRVPVFVRAHELVGRQDASIHAVLEAIVLKMQEVANAPFTADDLEAGRVVLLVDGLDELAATADRQEVVDFANKFVETYPQCSIAIATRPYSSISNLNGIVKFKRYRLSPLSMKDAEKMLKGAVKGEEEAGWRKEILRRLDNVHGIELNPLLVSVFAVSSGIEKRDIPANITELFAKFTELMLGRWDEKKGLSQQYQARVKEHLLSAFAFRLQSAGESRFLRADFTDFAKAKLAEMNLSADLNTIVAEIADRSGLLRGDEELEFKHHLLQEYFASKGIPDLKWVKQVIDQEWWRNSIVFYFGAQPDAVNDLLEVATDDCTSAENSYLTIGLALQACYLSKLDDRVEVWKWVVEGAAIAAMQDVENLNLDGDYPVTQFLARYLEGRESVALTGIEKASTGAEQWVINGNHTKATPELRRFWYAAALVELGQFKMLESILRSHPLESDLLTTAIHFGCYFSVQVKALSTESKKKADDICRMLEPRVTFLRGKIAKELRGQLLEYRRGGVVALDAPDPLEVEADTADEI